MKTIQIKTLTPTYDSIEDRIRLSINYQDIDNRIDFMITRSFIIQLLPILDEYLYKHYSEYKDDEDMIEIKAQEARTQDSNVSSTNVEDIHLYKSLEDLLVTINLKYDANTNLTYIEFISKEGHKASTTCDIDMLKSIIKSIKSTIPNFSWGISSHF